MNVKFYTRKESEILTVWPYNLEVSKSKKPLRTCYLLNSGYVLKLRLKRRHYTYSSNNSTIILNYYYLWNNIVYLLFSADFLKPKWKNLKDIYIRESKRSGKQRIKWRYYECLKFLEESISNDNKNIDGKDKNLEESGQYEVIDAVIQPEQDPIQTDPSGIITIIKLESLEKTGHNGLDKMEILQSNGEVIPIKSKNISQVETNEDETEYDLLYLQSLLHYFKDLTPLRKLAVRSKIQEILLNEFMDSMNEE